jgi:hypothetical protein
MLSFFPKPYSDEILYSTLARYYIRSGNRSPKLTQQELFNSNHAIATVDLPSSLEVLAANLSLVSQITVEDLIRNYTLYPFYAAFLPQARSQQIFEAMQSDQGEDIHNRIGIRASSIKLPKFFRFCPQCIENDRSQYGELYWHRVHQVPGVLVCPDHAEVLQSSAVLLQGFNRHEYHAASSDNCIPNQIRQNFSEKTLEVLLLLAQDVQFLLVNELPSKDISWFSKQYTLLLIEQGLATATGRVHQRQLIDRFIYFYGRQALEVLDSTVDNNDDCNWLSNIVRKHRKAFHPIRHLLMIRFLGVPIAEFFHDRVYQPFGAGPWLCLNAAAKHFLKPVVTQLEISLCCNTKKPVGTFSCSCGFVYCRTGPDRTEEDTRRIGKIKAVGGVWQRKLKHLVEVERAGLRKTARRLQVDPNTVTRYVKLLGLTPGWQSSNPKQEKEVSQHSPDLETIRAGHRAAWKLLQRQHRHASKTALRQLAPALYAWLYRNDREWLNQNSPARQPVAQKNRVDWPSRDTQVLIEVQQVVQRLLAAEKPIRITISRVAKAIGQLALIEQHLDKLPSVKTYLDSVTESIEDFQIRRVHWTAKQLDRQAEVIEPWKIIRMAGLRSNYSERVAKAIEQAIRFKATVTV